MSYPTRSPALQTTTISITIDLGKPLRSLGRLVVIPLATLYRISSLDSVIVVSSSRRSVNTVMTGTGGQRARELVSAWLGERVGLLEHEDEDEDEDEDGVEGEREDLYGDDEDVDKGGEDMRFTPQEEEESPMLGSTKIESPYGELNSSSGSGVKYTRTISILTRLSLGLSGLSILVFVIALIILFTSSFNDLGSWTSRGYHRYKRETATGLVISSITTSICFLTALRNVKRPLPVGFSAFLDLIVVSVLLPMAIYAVTIAFPTENWCHVYDSCLKLVMTEKILVIISAVLGILLSFIHFALLILRSCIIKDARPWKSLGSVRFRRSRMYRLDIDVTISRRPRRQKCSCCTRHAVSHHAGGANPVRTHPVYADEGRRGLDV